MTPGDIARPGFEEAVEIWSQFAQDAGWVFERLSAIPFGICLSAMHQDRTFHMVAAARRSGPAGNPNRRGVLAWKTFAALPFKTCTNFGFSSRATALLGLTEGWSSGYWQTCHSPFALFRTNNTHPCAVIAQKEDVRRIFQHVPSVRMSVERNATTEKLVYRKLPADVRLVLLSVAHAVTDARTIYLLRQCLYSVHTALVECDQALPDAPDYVFYPLSYK